MLTFLPTPIGNLEDISLRALGAISSCNVVLCEDTRVTKRLFDLLHTKGHLKNLPNAQFISFHSHNEEHFLSGVDPSFFDQNVLFASDAGMPCISDPGAKLVAYAQEKGIVYDVLPGANAALLAYVASGFLDGKFTFYGFLPHKGKDREVALDGVLAHPYDVVLYESPHRLDKLLEELAQKAPNRALFLLKEATKLYQGYFSGTAMSLYARIAKGAIKGEWCVVIKAQGEEKKIDAELLELVLSSGMPKKSASKLLAKLSGESVKYWYDYLLEQDDTE